MNDLLQLGIGGAVAIIILERCFAFIKGFVRTQDHTRKEADRQRERDLEIRDIDLLREEMGGWFKQLLGALERIEGKLENLKK